MVHITLRAEVSEEVEHKGESTRRNPRKDRRPAEIEVGIIPGHWKGDLIMSKYTQSAMGTLVERTTRYVIMVPLKAMDAVSCAEGLRKRNQDRAKRDRKDADVRPGKQTKHQWTHRSVFPRGHRFPHGFSERDKTGITSTQPATTEGN